MSKSKPARHSPERSREGDGGSRSGKQTPEVVVAGHICLDVIPQFPAIDADYRKLMQPGKLVKVGPPVLGTGGAVSNTGLALNRLGLATRLMGKVGDDLFGRAILEIVRGHAPALAEGMIVDRRVPSSYTVVVNPPGIDRMFLHCMGANDTFAAADVDLRRLTGARLFHFGYPPLMRRFYADGGGQLQTLFRRVKQRGLTTALDLAMPDPESDAGRAPWRQILAGALPHVDIFLPSIEEILFMLDRARFDALEQQAAGAGLLSQIDGRLLGEIAAELLGMGAAVVVLKLGDRGLYLRTTTDLTRLRALGGCAPEPVAPWLNRELLAPCFKTTVVGTTGSGDCTIAGFLAGLLQGLSPADTMTAAVAVGACNVEAADALGGIQPWAKVQRRIRAGWPRLPSQLNLPGWQWDDAHRVWSGPGDQTAVNR